MFALSGLAVAGLGATSMYRIISIVGTPVPERQNRVYAMDYSAAAFAFVLISLGFLVFVVSLGFYSRKRQPSRPGRYDEY